MINLFGAFLIKNQPAKCKLLLLHLFITDIINMDLDFYFDRPLLQPIGNIAERFLLLCLKDSGVLYEDPNIQVMKSFVRFLFYSIPVQVSLKLMLEINCFFCRLV